MKTNRNKQIIRFKAIKLVKKPTIVFSKSDMLPDDFINRIIKYKEKIVEKTDLNEIIVDFNLELW